MRTRTLALPLLLLSLSNAQAADQATEHASLGKHEHGIASVNIALDDRTLEIALESPTMNIVGFEHAASSAADKAKVATARAILEKPLELFGLPAEAQCTVLEAEVKSQLFAQDAPAQTHETGEAHSDIDAAYKLSCSKPEALTSISLAPLFQHFPDTQKIAAQLIGPGGQQGAELTPEAPVIGF